MIKIYKYFLLSFLFSSLLNYLWAQTVPLHNYTLTTNETGATKNYVARDYIALNPGFEYNAIGGNSFSAMIDPFTIDLNPFPNQVKTAPDIAGNSYVVGAMDGSASVSPSGAASYEIPIKVPQGTGGMTPQLSIEYSSQGADGLLGVGFSISGLSVISRCPRNIKDYAIRPVSLDDQDRFSLDGNRLIAIPYGGTYGANGTEYRTENNSFSKIISYTTTNTGPESFVVYTKSGLIYEYGKTTDSQFKAQNSEHVISWLLNKVTDTKGNYYTISYIQDNVNGTYKPDRIDYTGNKTTIPELATYASVRFIYDYRTVTNTTYIKGNKSCVFNLLSNIQVFYQGNIVKSYILKYNTPNFGKYLLASVTETSANGDKLNPVTFDWFLNNVYKPKEWTNDQSTYPAQFVKYDNEIYLGDFNGDGKTDFVATPKTGTYANKWGLFLTDNSGTKCNYENNAVLDAGFEKIYTGDFNGDGKTDIIQRSKPNSTTTYYRAYFSTGTNFTSGKFICSVTNRVSELIIGDYNGDGISDAVLYIPGDTDYTLFYGFCSSGVVTPLVEGYARDISTNWDRVETGDFDGDGRTDIMNLNDSGYEMLNGDGIVLNSTATKTWPQKNHIINIGDFNGDGKSDMLVTGYNNTTWGDWIMDYSTGIGFDEKRIPKQFDSFSKQIFVGDLNGDGKDDFYAVDKTGTGWLVIMRLYISDSSTSCFSYQDGNPVYPLDTWKFYSGDFNGDGRMDYLDRAKNSNGFTGYQLQNSITDRDQLLKSVTDSYGNTISFTYKSMTNKAVYTPFTDGAYPVSDFTGAMPLVDKMTQPDGKGGTKSTSYKYAGAKLHKQGNGFLGFSQFTITDDQTGISSISIYDFDRTYYVMGLKRAETRITKGVYINKLLSEADYANTYREYGGNSPKIYTYLPTSTTEKKYELNSTTPYSTISMSYTYDSYGNVLSTSQSIGTEATISSVNVYTNNTSNSNWLLGRLTSATVTKHVTNQTDIIRKSTFEYNPTSGLLEKETVEPGNVLLGYYKTYEHDGFGNIVKTTTFADGKSRSQRSVYDDKGRFEVESYDAMDNKVTKVFDPIYCSVTSVTDPNSLTATTTYDSFGREKSGKGPDGSMSVVAYRWCNGDENTPTDAVWFKYAEVSGKPGATVYYDKFGRVIRKAVVGFDGRMIYVDTEYNALGQVSRESDPYFKGETSQWTGFVYDELGRIIQKTLPDASTIKITYNGLTTITENPLGQKDTKEINQQGQLIKSTNADEKIITYLYNSAGNMIEMRDSKNNVVKMEYDILGNRTKLDDPELGISTSVYNAFGELTSETDGKNNLLTMEYDDLGRMKKRTEAEGVTYWLYDTGTCGIGRLASVTNSGGYVQATEYDKFGRVAKVEETIAGTTYTTLTDYDSYSRVIRTYYPSIKSDGPVVRNEYNTNGYLSKVSDLQTSKVYWTASAVNARGQMTQSLYGNGMQTTNTYDPVTGLLKHIKTEKGYTKVQDWEYLFDALGNLKKRADDKRGLSETFEYDNLNRLKFVYKNTNVQTLAITYDELGNIDTKSDVGKYIYDKPGCPHAVTRIDKYNGSILKEITQNISYTSFDKVSTISQGTDSLSLGYCSAYQRIYGESYQNKVLKKRRVYVNSLYEQENDFTSGNTRETFYIFGGDGLVAIRVKDNSGDKVSYVHKDHLGSIQCLTDDAGALAQEMSYDAWGNRRNADTWQVYTTPQSGLITDRGFTGHEHIDLFDLVNMNGRVYDPVIGRFLSADPIIQNPENLQSLNRYSYCLNNPLSLTDPSGYSWLSNNWRSLVGAAIGIAATVVTAGILAPAGLATLTALGATAAGAVGGFAGGFAGTLLNGGDLGQAFKAGVVGGIVGGASGFLAFAAGGISGNSIGAILERMGRHAFANAWLSGMQGQNMFSGMLTGGASSLGGAGLTSLNIENVGLLAAGNAVIGGTVSVIGGGKFANGAVTGAFTMLFNEAVHKANELHKSKQNNATKQFIAIVVGESTNNVDEAAAIGSVIMNRLDAKGASISDGFVDKIGGAGQYDAIGGPHYEKIMKSSWESILSSDNPYYSRIAGAILSLSGTDYSGGAYMWNASSPQTGFNWRMYDKGIFSITKTIGGTTFFKYSNTKKTWP